MWAAVMQLASTMSHVYMCMHHDHSSLGLKVKVKHLKFRSKVDIQTCHISAAPYHYTKSGGTEG